MAQKTPKPLNFLSIVNSIPGCHLILLPNAPHFTIVAATDAYLSATHHKRETLVEQSIFKINEPATNNPRTSEIKDLAASLADVLQHKQEHRMNEQRYEIFNPDTKEYAVRIWCPVNKPVLDENGEVQYIIHSAGDVTEKMQWQQAEEKTYQKLVESVNNLRNTILQAPIAMCILRGPSYTVEIANDRMYKLWGRREEEMLNRPFFEGLPEAAGKGLEPLLAQVYTTGETCTGESRPVTVHRKDSSETVYIDFVYEPFREGDGTISGIIAVAMDVTEQTRIRKTREENEAELQKRVEERTADLQQQKVFIGSILDASFNGIYALKAVRNEDGQVADFTYLFVNSTIANLLNRKAEDVIGASMLQLIPENKSNGFFDLFCSILQSGKTHRDETHFVTPNIDNWYKYVIVPIDKETVVVSIEDITEKKRDTIQIEEQRNLLDSILKNSSNGISVSQVFRDGSGKVVDALTILANDAAVKYIGLPKDIYLSKRATEIEPSVIGSPYYQQCIKTLETGQPFVMQYRMESTGKWLELTVSKLDNDHLIQVFTDVTPIKEVQIQLEKYVEELKRSNQNLEEFAYAASHDMKEPIRKIQLFSDRLKHELSDKLNDMQVHLFNRMERATQRMSLLIDDLLTYSHVSKGITNAEYVDLNVKVQNVLEDLEVEIEKKRTIVTVDDLPTVKGHRRQLQQLFQNLIGNALKYTKHDVPAEVHISSRVVFGYETKLSLYPEEARRQYYLITVKDNGIGFEQEDAERIFNVFTRLHGNAEYEGTGVGLSIAQKVIQNHQGYIWAESEPGKGSSFYVLLPLD